LILREFRSDFLEQPSLIASQRIRGAAGRARAGRKGRLRVWRTPERSDGVGRCLAISRAHKSPAPVGRSAGGGIKRDEGTRQRPRGTDRTVRVDSSGRADSSGSVATGNSQPTKGRVRHLAQVGADAFGRAVDVSSFRILRVNHVQTNTGCIYMHRGAYIAKIFCKKYWVFIAYP
jgi:hypothetical protein